MRGLGGETVVPETDGGVAPDGAEEETVDGAVLDVVDAVALSGGIS